MGQYHYLISFDVIDSGRISSYRDQIITFLLERKATNLMSIVGSTVFFSSITNLEDWKIELRKLNRDIHYHIVQMQSDAGGAPKMGLNANKYLMGDFDDDVRRIKTSINN